MKGFKKIFVALAVLSFIFASVSDVQAKSLESQELRAALPVLPDRIRHRNDSHKLQRPPKRDIKLPHRQQEDSTFKYTQRHPKNPPKMTTPSRPIATSDRRGSIPPKNFGPPRFR